MSFHNEVVDRYEIYISKIEMDPFSLCTYFYFLYQWHDFYRAGLWVTHGVL